MTRSLSDSRIRGSTRYGGSAPWLLTADPPCIVICPHCQEAVIAAHKLYFDNPGQAHRHKPHLADGYKTVSFEPGMGPG